MGKAQRGETGGISAGEHDGELQGVVQRSVFGTGFVHYGGHDHGQQQRVADIEQADLHGGQHGVQRGGFFGKGKRGKDGHLNGEQHAHQAAAAVFSGKQAGGRRGGHAGERDNGGEHGTDLFGRPTQIGEFGCEGGGGGGVGNAGSEQQGEPGFTARRVAPEQGKAFKQVG